MRGLSRLPVELKDTIKSFDDYEARQMLADPKAFRAAKKIQDEWTSYRHDARWFSPRRQTRRWKREGRFNDEQYCEVCGDTGPFAGTRRVKCRPCFEEGAGVRRKKKSRRKRKSRRKKKSRWKKKSRRKGSNHSMTLRRRQLEGLDILADHDLSFITDNLA